MTLWIPEPSKLPPTFYFPLLNFFCYVRIPRCSIFLKCESDSKRRFDDKWPDLVARNVVLRSVGSGANRKRRNAASKFFSRHFFIFPSSPIRLLQLSTPNNGILVSRVTPGGLLGRRFDYVPAIFFCRPRKKPKKSSSTRNQNCLSMALLTQKAPKGPLNRKSTDESSTLLFVRLESVGLSRWRQRMWRHDDAASKKKTSAEYCFFVLCLSLLLLFELLYSYVYLLMYIHVLRPV